jgi:hypothetical protein
MAYYIFLKSLSSLEEFRKSAHIKIPPKSPCTNFQSLDIFKNPFLFQKEFSFKIWHSRPSHPLACSAFRPTRSPPPLVPWMPPPPSPISWSPQRPPPSSIAHSYPPPRPSFTLGNDSHEGAKYRRYPPFLATPASLRPL